MNFWLSTAMLLLGPVLYAWGRSRPVARQVLNGFVLVAVAGIVCMNIVPGAIRHGGWPAVIALLVGLAFPVVIEKVFRHSVHRAHGFIVVLAALGLVLHAFIDGIALLPDLGASPTPNPADPAATVPLVGTSLALGVLLHRLPVGMVLWWSVRPYFGTRMAVAVFALLITATGLAYYFGSPVVALAETRSIATFQAFVAGSLAHVVAFGVSHRHRGDDAMVATDNWGFRAGILLGLFLLFALPHVS